jgi:hypothetical protein
MRPLVERFFKLCDRHGVERAAERVMLGAARKRLEKVFGVTDSGGF